MSSLNSREPFGYETSERTQDSKRDLTARRVRDRISFFENECNLKMCCVVQLDVVSMSTAARPEASTALLYINVRPDMLMNRTQVFVHVETHEMVDVVDKGADGDWPSDRTKCGALDEHKMQVQYSSEVV